MTRSGPSTSRSIMKLTTAVGAALLATAVASANTIVTITADNHYALFTSLNGGISYHGGNELGAAGNPGTYNWSMAETYTLPAADELFIAAWSDDQVAQGVLAHFQSDALGDILSGDPRWEVYGTGVNRGDGDPHPSAFEIAGYVATASAGNLWGPTFVGGANGVAPWGPIAGISSGARWMWLPVAGDSDPLNGGSGDSEMLIFRLGGTTVPTPGSMALMGLGGLAMLRRRR